jgi:esterase/lipase superfamily enzyme
VIDIERGKDYATVQVYYATDRAFTGETERASDVYGIKRGGLSRGIAHVSIPRLHRIGNVEAPSVLRFEFREDPEKHIVLLRVLPQRQRDFYAKLRESVARSRKHEAFIFVHGFANTFADAAKRTAQIKYDLAYDGPAILFSWPSLGSAKPLSYTADEAAAEWATSHFRDFLLELAQNSGAQSISVVAHSMGNRILARAFERLPESQQPRFAQVVLTAPDIDVDVFKELAQAIRKPAGHVTLYVSKNDEALRISKSVHGGIPRAGDSSESVLVLEGIETVDVSKVDTSFSGHSYIAENRTVLSDVYCLIRGGAQAARRCRLVAHGGYWEFVGQLEDVPSLAQYTCSAPGCPFSARP